MIVGSLLLFFEHELHELNEHISTHAEEYMETAEKWCHHVLQFYRGNEKAAIELRKVLDRLRPFITDYVRNVLRLREEYKVQFIVDEVMSETMLRTLERQAVIYSPYNYMQRLCRHFHDIIKDVGGIMNRRHIVSN